MIQKSLNICMHHRVRVHHAGSMRYFCGKQTGEIETSSNLLSLPSSDIDNANAENVTMMRFDTLGPAVVTENGKVRFFEDWEGKTEQEKEDILKIIIPRNQKRLAKLKEANDQHENNQQGDNTTSSLKDIDSRDPP